jgi:hypothetical protein
MHHDMPKPAIDMHQGRMPELVTRDEPQDMQNRAGWNVGRATAMLAHGDAAGALAAGEAAWASRADLGTHSFSKEGYALALDAAFELGDFDRVEQLLAEVRAMSPGLTPPFLRAHSARSEGRLAAARDAHDRVEASFVAAVDGFRAFDASFWTAVCELELAEWLRSQDRAGEAEQYLARARASFERQRAEPWLARVDAASERVVATTS